MVWNKPPATPPHFVEIAVEDILTCAGIYSQSHKWHIVDTINQQFHAINEQMGQSEQPHENMKMYLHTLSMMLSV